MKRACLLTVALTLGATFPRAATPTITIDASAPAGKVSPLLYGLMTEEINHSYDGGLYAELIRNRVPVPQWPAQWFEVQDNIRRADVLLGAVPAPGAALERSARVRSER